PKDKDPAVSYENMFPLLDKLKSIFSEIYAKMRTGDLRPFPANAKCAYCPHASVCPLADQPQTDPR
ncbi:MAG: PD-(D/E)XK nuclease family protein, partial [Deltaproteobacteria bacterium]|nr:PD-(D/E)XK nuclease family protein [Deltaproteobacteria bacterium]